jgi:hypothetical protein
MANRLPPHAPSYYNCRIQPIPCRSAFSPWTPGTESCQSVTDRVLDRLRTITTGGGEKRVTWDCKRLTGLLGELGCNPEKADLLSLYFEGFADLLFGALELTDLCDFEFVQTADPGWLGSDVWGMMTPARDPDGDGLSGKTLVQVFQKTDQPDGTLRAAEYLGTMVHELVHAVVSIYVCRCQEVCAVDRAALSKVGQRGHGAVFQVICHAIETFSRDILELNLDTNRTRSLAFELVQGTLDADGKLPKKTPVIESLVSTIECEEMRIDYEDLADHYEAFQEEFDEVSRGRKEKSRSLLSSKI